MNEHELCCGTVADKSKICAEIAERDSVIRAKQRRIGELLQERINEYAIKIEELERERNELAAQVERLRQCARESINGLSAIQAVDFPFDINGFIAILENMLKETPEIAAERLRQEWNCPTVENGRNRYGLDVSYFRNLFNRELNRTLQNYRPHELARNLMRMARTADKAVISEPEFTGELKAQWQAEAFDVAESMCKRMSESIRKCADGEL